MATTTNNLLLDLNDIELGTAKKNDKELLTDLLRQNQQLMEMALNNKKPQKGKEKKESDKVRAGEGMAEKEKVGWGMKIWKERKTLLLLIIAAELLLLAWLFSDVRTLLWGRLSAKK